MLVSRRGDPELCARALLKISTASPRGKRLAGESLGSDVDSGKIFTLRYEGINQVEMLLFFYYGTHWNKFCNDINKIIGKETT